MIPAALLGGLVEYGKPRASGDDPRVVVDDAADVP